MHISPLSLMSAAAIIAVTSITSASAVSSIHWEFDSSIHGHRWVGTPSLSSSEIISPVTLDNTKGTAEFLFTSEWNQLQTKGAASFTEFPIVLGLDIAAQGASANSPAFQFGFKLPKAQCDAGAGMMLVNGTWFDSPCFNSVPASAVSKRTLFPKTVVSNKLVIDKMTSQETKDAGFIGGGISITYYPYSDCNADYYKYFMPSLQLTYATFATSSVSGQCQKLKTSSLDYAFDSVSHSRKWIGKPAVSSMILPASFSNTGASAQFKFSREWLQLLSQGAASFTVAPIYGITMHAPNGNTGLHFGFQADKAECVDGMVVSNGTWYNFPCFNGDGPSDVSKFTKTNFPVTVIPNKLIISKLGSQDANAAGFIGGGIAVTYYPYSSCKGDHYRWLMPSQLLTFETFVTEVVAGNCATSQ